MSLFFFSFFLNSSLFYLFFLFCSFYLEVAFIITSVRLFIDFFISRDLIVFNPDLVLMFVTVVCICRGLFDDNERHKTYVARLVACCRAQTMLQPLHLRCSWLWCILLQEEVDSSYERFNLYSKNQIYVCVCLFVCLSICICLCTYACLLCMCLYLCLCICVCTVFFVNVCIYYFLCVYIRVHINALFKKNM